MSKLTRNKKIRLSGRIIGNRERKMARLKRKRSPRQRLGWHPNRQYRVPWPKLAKLAQKLKKKRTQTSPRQAKQQRRRHQPWQIILPPLTSKARSKKRNSPKRRMQPRARMRAKRRRPMPSQRKRQQKHRPRRMEVQPRRMQVQPRSRVRLPKRLLLAQRL